MIQLPEKFLETIRTQLDDEFDAFLESYSRPVLGGIRINRLKITPEEYLAPDRTIAGVCAVEWRWILLQRRNSLFQKSAVLCGALLHSGAERHAAAHRCCQ